jgi:hypothetical protein
MCPVAFLLKCDLVYLTVTSIASLNYEVMSGICD